MPEVSVIIPTYNYGRFIPRAIESVLNQTYRNFEIIIVDDASRDETDLVVRGYITRNVKYIKHNVNKGGSAARNTGIKESSGQYIAFLDSDDEWHYKKLELQINKFKASSNDVGMIYTGISVIDMDTGNIIERRLPIAKGYIFNELLEKNWVTGGSSPIIKKTCFKEVGLFDERFPSCQDWEMWLRISQKYYIDFIDKPLVNYFFHDKNTESDPMKVIMGNKIFLEKYKSYYFNKIDLYANRHYILGIRYCNVNLLHDGKYHFIQAFRYSSFRNLKLKIKSILQYLAIFLGARRYFKLKKFASFLTHKEH